MSFGALLFPAHTTATGGAKYGPGPLNFYQLPLYLLCAPLIPARLSFRRHSPSVSRWVTTTTAHLPVFLWELILMPHLLVSQLGVGSDTSPPSSASVRAGPETSQPSNVSVGVGPDSSLDFCISEVVHLDTSHLSCEGIQVDTFLSPSIVWTLLTSHHLCCQCLLLCFWLCLFSPTRLKLLRAHPSPPSGRNSLRLNLLRNHLCQRRCGNLVMAHFNTSP